MHDKDNKLMQNFSKKTQTKEFEIELNHPRNNYLQISFKASSPINNLPEVIEEIKF